jgi:hypothetical protein
MTDRRYMREVVINRIVAEYPGLCKIPDNSESYKEILYTLCSQHNISRRTMIEYVNIARIKIKQIEKDLDILKDGNN